MNREVASRKMVNQIVSSVTEYMYFLVLINEY